MYKRQKLGTAVAEGTNKEDFRFSLTLKIVPQRLLIADKELQQMDSICCVCLCVIIRVFKGTEMHSWINNSRSAISVISTVITHGDTM